LLGIASSLVGVIESFEVGGSTGVGGSTVNYVTLNSIYLSAVTLFPHHRELPVIMMVAEGQEVIAHAARALAALLQTVTPET
jgi:hypothetical protein